MATKRARLSAAQRRAMLERYQQDFANFCARGGEAYETPREARMLMEPQAGSVIWIRGERRHAPDVMTYFAQWADSGEFAFLGDGDFRLTDAGRAALASSDGAESEAGSTPCSLCGHVTTGELVQDANAAGVCYTCWVNSGVGL